MSLQDAIKDVQSTIAGITGIRNAPEYPPEDSAVYPFAIAFAGPGEFRVGEPAGQLKYLGTIIVELHIARKDLPRDVENAMDYHDLIPKKILEDTTLGGKADTCGPVTSSGLVVMEYAAQQTIGFRFEIQGVKTKSTFS